MTDPKGIGDDVYRLALPLLVERLGGVVEITEAEQQAFAERHGGIRQVRSICTPTRRLASG